MAKRICSSLGIGLTDVIYHGEEVCEARGVRLMIASGLFVVNEYLEAWVEEKQEPLRRAAQCTRRISSCLHGEYSITGR